MSSPNLELAEKVMVDQQEFTGRHGYLKSSYEYGYCHICGGKMREEHMKQEFWIKGKLIVIESR